MVTVDRIGQRRVVVSCDAAARAAGISAGDVLARAQARVPSLVAFQAQPVRDAEALGRLARWMHRYTPLVTVDLPDGIWLDTTGCDHLRGGEQALLADILGRLTEAGFAARAAIADTPGCAHAVARHGPDAATVVQAGSAATLRALDGLPVGALRLESGHRDAAHRIGFDRIGDVVSQTGSDRVGRGPVAHRAGAGLLTRLDQALGRSFEPLAPQVFGDCISHRMAFAEPLSGRDGLEAAVGVLVGRACGDLERAGEGALAVDLLFEAMDQSSQAIRVGTSYPTRTKGHLARMLADGLERIEAERGIEAMRITVSATAVLANTQFSIGSDEPSRVMIAELADRLAARAISVWRASIDPNRPPETSLVENPPMTEADATPVKAARGPALKGPRPSRLLVPPQPINVIGLLPDYPPAQFVWRRQRHRVRRADGPERLYRRCPKPVSADPAGSGAAFWTVRDYFTVENEAGQRFWLVREGDGVNAETGNLSWYLQGLF